MRFGNIPGCGDVLLWVDGTSRWVKTVCGLGEFAGSTMFEAFYNSYYQHPLLLWAAPVAFLFVLARKRHASDPFLFQYLWWFTFLTIVDPLVTGPVVAASGAPAAVAQAVGILFVILGDLRLFALIENYGYPGPPGGRRRWTGALVLSLIVPILQVLLIEMYDESFENPRLTYLVYEVMFFVVAAAFRYVVLPKRAILKETRDWLSWLCSYAMLYYALWAISDVFILSGLDLGYGLRVLPNILYYGLFLPFVFWTAPRSKKGRVASVSGAIPSGESR